VIDRDLEETLNLACMKVHREDAIGARCLEQISDEARRNRLPRGRLLSWREYGNQGITAVMRCAEASRAAWIINRSSTRWSFTGGEHDCTRKTSAPRIDAPNRQYVSPFANVSCSTGPRPVPSRAAIRAASSGFDVPEKTKRLRRSRPARSRPRMSVVTKASALRAGEQALLAAWTSAEIVREP
jgi:hypothetical protein